MLQKQYVKVVCSYREDEQGSNCKTNTVYERRVTASRELVIACCLSDLPK